MYQLLLVIILSVERQTGFAVSFSGIPGKPNVAHSAGDHSQSTARVGTATRCRAQTHFIYRLPSPKLSSDQVHHDALPSRLLSQRLKPLRQIKHDQKRFVKLKKKGTSMAHTLLQQRGRYKQKSCIYRRYIVHEPVQVHEGSKELQTCPRAKRIAERANRKTVWAFDCLGWRPHRRLLAQRPFLFPKFLILIQNFNQNEAKRHKRSEKKQKK